MKRRDLKPITSANNYLRKALAGITQVQSSRNIAATLDTGDLDFIFQFIFLFYK